MDRNADKKPNISMEDAIKLAESDAGKQLIALLQKSNSESVRSAMDQAAAGDYGKAKQTLSSILSSPEVRALLKQLGG